jgi:hypothetical protein
MLRFPAAFGSPSGIAETLYRTAIWSGGRKNSVWVPQFAAVKRLVREISRTPSGSRIRNLFREVNLWPEDIEVSASLPPRGAADMFEAAQTEAMALLELGYPRTEGIDFGTRLPCPGTGSPRTRSEIRAAIHHLGGDMDLTLSLLRTPDRFHPALRVTFSVWPHQQGPAPGAADTVSLHLHHQGQTVPAVMTFSRALAGYCLLAVFDLAAAVSKTSGASRTSEDFETFADAFLRSQSSD